MACKHRRCRAVLFCLGWSLLGVGGEALEAEEEQEDHCRCLPWREVYASKRAICGETLELMNFFRPRKESRPEDIAAVQNDTGAIGGYVQAKCAHWLHHWNSTRCLNVDTAHYNGEHSNGDFFDQTWCYVSSRCQDLNGGSPLANKTSVDGEPLPRDVSVRICDKRQDKLLRLLDPLELLEESKTLREMLPDSKVTFGFLAMEAYRAVSGDKAWPSTIQGAWDLRVFEFFPPRMQACMLRKEPIVVPVESFWRMKIVHGWRLIHVSAELDPFGRSRCRDTFHCVQVDPFQF